MGATRAVRVLISSAAESPSVTGWIRPVILLPASTLLGLTPEQLEAVLAHEIAHIRRHDYLVNLLQTLVETLLFYHPAVRWASSRIRRERELCCDDAAVREYGDAIDYARALAKLERIRITPAVAPEMALGSNGGLLPYRLRRLTEWRRSLAHRRLRASSRWRWVWCVLRPISIGHTVRNLQTAQGQAIAINYQPHAAEEQGITVSTSGELLHRSRVTYPEVAMKQAIQGTVTLEATLDTAGNVSDARVTAVSRNCVKRRFSRCCSGILQTARREILGSSMLRSSRRRPEPNRTHRSRPSRAGRW
jgi:hypothetical protein